jgi:hypothetical protein
VKYTALRTTGAHLVLTITKQEIVAIAMLTQKNLIRLHRMPSVEMAAMTQYDGKKMNITSAKGLERKASTHSIPQSRNHLAIPPSA